MLEWFNALTTIFAEFLQLLLTLPFYGSVSIGYVLLCIALVGVLLSILIERIK